MLPGVMTTEFPVVIPSLGRLGVAYGERSRDPPVHFHVGPWAVFQAFDPRRYPRAHRDRAALAMRFLSMDPATPRPALVALGRCALEVVRLAHLLGHELDDAGLFVRTMRAAGWDRASTDDDDARSAA